MNLGNKEAPSIGHSEFEIDTASRNRPGPAEIGDLLAALWHYRYLVIAGALLCGIVGFVLTSFSPKIYEATATMIVSSPAFSTELKPEALSVQSYRAIAESPSILALVEEKLPDLPSDRFASLVFSTSIQPAQQGRNSNFLPLIDLNLRASSPELARRVANVWAEVASEEAAQLAKRGEQDTLEFIVHQFPATADNLSEKEVQLKSRQNHFDTASVELEANWRQRILNHENETIELRRDYLAETEQMLLDWKRETVQGLAEHRAETEKLRLEFLNQWKPSLVQSEFEVKASKIAAHQDDLLTMELRLLSLQDRIADLERVLAGEPRFWVHSKAITDEALWQQVGQGSEGGLPESLADVKLRSESVNPIYQWLSEQLAQSRVELATVSPRREHLAGEISRIQAEVDSVSSQVTEAEVGLSSLTKQRQSQLEQLEAARQSGLKQLQEERQTGLRTLLAGRESAKRDLEARRDLEIALLNREASVETARLNREIESVKKSYGVLSSKYEEALLAKSEETRDLKIGALAVLPRNPINRQRLFNSAIAALAGLVLTVVAAFFFEFARQDTEGRRRPAPDRRSADDQ